MGNGISEYVKTVKCLFPILGRPEKTYIKRLAANLEEMFQREPPASLDEIVARFGPPEGVVSDYLRSAEPDYLLQRMRRAKRWRLLAVWALVVLVVASALFVCLLWWEYSSYMHFMDGTFGYVVETIE